MSVGQLWLRPSLLVVPPHSAVLHVLACRAHARRGAHSDARAAHVDCVSVGELRQTSTSETLKLVSSIKKCDVYNDPMAHIGVSDLDCMRLIYVTERLHRRLILT